MPSPFAPFPFASSFSLERLIAFWEDARGSASPWAPVAEAIADRLGEAPALADSELTPAVLSDHSDLVDLMLSAVFPRAYWEETVAAVMPPFGTEVVYATPACAELGLFETSTLARRMSLDERGFEYGRTMMAYYLILEHCYGVHVPYDFPLILTQQDEETGLEQHFKLVIDTRFAWVDVHEPCPELSEADRARLVAAPTDRALWEELLPPERFTLCGFGVVSALDVTDEQILSLLKEALLQKGALTSEASIAALEPALRSLLHCPSARFGLICLEEGTLDDPTSHPAARRVRAVGRSLLLATGEAPFCPNRGASIYARALDERHAIVVPDLAAYEPQTGYEAHLLEQGFGSVLVAPLQTGARTVGLLELAAPEPNALNAFNTMKIDEVAGFFATAMRRSLDERQDHVQAIIKAQCTAIHPVVEWRFRAAALRFLDGEGEDRRMEPIVFPDVIPLYGLSDIRRSSSHRNEAIAEDLVEQLSLAFAVIVEASAHRSLPGLDELGFRLERTLGEIRGGLSAEHELGVLDFLRRDVESLFDHLVTYGPGVRERVAAYRDALDPALGMRYDARRRYEEAVTRINETISAHLERQEAYAQYLVPHYFERYKTDGVEYTIYVGDALLETGESGPLALRNLRLWQLMATCSTAWALDEIAPELPLPLETAHLILVQSNPLAIRFRYDEKQFDVDGAYNTRYEIIKKRIDKAYIAGTEQRLTQPGHLAIVLSQGRDVEEYRTYLAYLHAAGYVSGPVEEIGLESMPGVQGLRALRVPIAPNPDDGDFDVTPERMREVALGVG
jgi:GAF domain-containing protein